MSGREIFVRDISSIEELGGTIEQTADSLSDILEAVDQYLEDVTNKLEERKQQISDRLDNAKEKLEAALSALGRCEDSQTRDEDGNYTPSCDMERNNVERARDLVHEWEDKYKQAEDIVGEVRKEVGDYNKVQEATRPAGGRVCLESLATKHTEKALDGLQQCIQSIEDAMNVDMGGGSSSGESSNPNKSRSDLPLSEAEKSKRYNEMWNVNEKIQKEYNKNLATPNRTAVCASCGRPIVLCICRSKR